MSKASVHLARVTRPFATMSVRGKHISIVLAVAVHALLLAFLFYGVRWQSQNAETVEVELVRPVPLETAPAPSHAPPPSPPKVVPKPAPEPKVEPKPAPPLHKPDIAIKEKEKAKPTPPPPPPKVEAKPNPFQKQLEQELQRTAAARNEAELAKAASQELSKVRAAEAAAAKSKAMADYIGKIRAKIRGNIVLPPDIVGNPEAEFEVTQLPSGGRINVRKKKSSGHTGYDDAVERAIEKSFPLPKPERPDLFERELNLKFRPLED